MNVEHELSDLQARPRKFFLGGPGSYWPLSLCDQASHFSETRSKSVPSSILTSFFILSLDVGLGHCLHRVEHLPHRWSTRPGGLGNNLVEADTIIFHDED